MFMYVEMRKYMKKKLFSVLLVGALAASLVACGKTEKKEAKASTANTEINAEEYAGTITSNAGVYKTFVNLSDWKGMSVDLKESDYVVLDSDVEDYIKSMLESKATTNVITEGTTKAGDVIKLDYSGKLDGTAFSGGTATDVTYTIGSGKFIDDLDKGLVGLTVGQETDITCVFPESYYNSDLAGKTTVFTVTVNEIDESVVPELTDEWVAANAASLGIEDSSVTTVEQLRRSSAIFDAAYKQMSDGLDVSDYPSEELTDLINTLNSNVDAEYQSYSSSYSSKEEYLKSAYKFDSLDAFNEYADNYAKQYYRR